MSHVDRMIAEHARGRSVAELERSAGLRVGALAHTLKPSQRGRLPQLVVQQRFAEVLGVPLEQVSAAFAADVGGSAPMLGVTVVGKDEGEMLAQYRQLDQRDRAVARDLLAVLVKRSSR